MKIEVSNKRIDALGRSEWDRIALPKTKRDAFVIAKKKVKKVSKQKCYALIMMVMFADITILRKAN